MDERANSALQQPVDPDLQIRASSTLTTTRKGECFTFDTFPVSSLPKHGVRTPRERAAAYAISYEVVEPVTGKLSCGPPVPE